MLASLGCSRLGIYSCVYMCSASKRLFHQRHDSCGEFSLLLVAGTLALSIPAGLPDDTVTSSAKVPYGYKMHGNPSVCNCSMGV